jgi:uncharacterized protein (TIGR02147 family)
MTTGPKVRSLAVRNFHRAMLKAASGTLDTVSPNRRDVTSLTFALSPAQYDLVRSKIESFRRELLDLIDDSPAAEDDDETEVYHLGFQLFPLTRRRES